MAAEPTSAAGSTDVFQELDSYPWDQDTEFQVSRSSISDFMLQPRLSVTERSPITERRLYSQVKESRSLTFF